MPQQAQRYENVGMVYDEHDGPDCLFDALFAAPPEPKSGLVKSELVRRVLIAHVRRTDEYAMERLVTQRFGRSYTYYPTLERFLIGKKSK